MDIFIDLRPAYYFYIGLVPAIPHKLGKGWGADAAPQRPRQRTLQARHANGATVAGGLRAGVIYKSASPQEFVAPLIWLAGGYRDCWRFSRRFPSSCGNRAEPPAVTIARTKQALARSTPCCVESHRAPA